MKFLISLTKYILVIILTTISIPAYSHIKCPVKFLGTTNDRCPHSHGVKQDVKNATRRANEEGKKAVNKVGDFLHLGGNGCLVKARDVNNSHPRSRGGLTQAQKRYLRPWFGNTVDKVSVVWGARLSPQISVGNWVVAIKPSAQTFGYNIYIRSKRVTRGNINEMNQIILLAHEMEHVKQYERNGKSLKKFCQKYMDGYTNAGFSYDRNPLEKSANTVESKFTTWLVKEYTRETNRPQAIPSNNKPTSTSYNRQSSSLSYKSPYLKEKELKRKQNTEYLARKNKEREMKAELVAGLLSSIFEKPKKSAQSTTPSPTPIKEKEKEKILASIEKADKNPDSQEIVKNPIKINADLLPQPSVGDQQIQYILPDTSAGKVCVTTSQKLRSSCYKNNSKDKCDNEYKSNFIRCGGTMTGKKENKAKEKFKVDEEDFEFHSEAL